MPDVYVISHQPHTFTGRSGFVPFVEAVNARPVCYDVTWLKLQTRSWTLGNLLRRFGNWYYGSEWNALVPWRDELRIARSVSRGRGVVHFLWGEFASPRLPDLLRRKGHRLVGTFHCSARRQPSVLGRFRCWGAYDWFSVVSESQIPYMIAQGVPRKRIRFLPLGVDTEHFRPDDSLLQQGERPLQAILVGQTERDHEFAAELMRRMPPGLLNLQVRTAPDYHGFYSEMPSVCLLPRLGDNELLSLYQSADLMLMPMLDCTANDAMLEAMACGTPVMTNRVGGVPEYLDASCNFVMEGKRADEWIDVLKDMMRNRSVLGSRRAAVRQSMSRFSWKKVATQYIELYASLLNS